MSVAKKNKMPEDRTRINTSTCDTRASRRPCSAKKLKYFFLLLFAVLRACIPYYTSGALFVTLIKDNYFGAKNIRFKQSSR